MTTEAKIEDNSVVALAFVLTDVDGGDELDRSTEDQPLLYMHGHDNLMPGLEAVLAGRKVGDRFEVDLAPEDAFGPRIPDAERTIPRDAFPNDVELEAGMELAMEDDGDVIPFWIKEVADDQIVIDLNHPFSGRTVRFAGEISRIREATADELEHGHPHGIEGTEGH